MATNVTILLQAATPLETDLAHGAAPAASVTALRSAANSLGSATRAADRNVILACISGAHPAEVAGLASLGSAVTGFENALSAIGSGDDPTAHGNIRTAITAMQSGSADMAKATADLSRYGAKCAGSRPAGAAGRVNLKRFRERAGLRQTRPIRAARIAPQTFTTGRAAAAG